MNRNALPEDVRRLCGSFRQACGLHYVEIVRNEDARRAIERWPMFSQLKLHRLIAGDRDERVNPTAER